jgi:hypothetical protein
VDAEHKNWASAPYQCKWSASKTAFRVRSATIWQRLVIIDHIIYFVIRTSFFCVCVCVCVCVFSSSTNLLSSVLYDYTHQYQQHSQIGHQNYFMNICWPVIGHLRWSRCWKILEIRKGCRWKYRQRCQNKIRITSWQ